LELGFRESQQEALAEILQELMTDADCADACYETIVAAIDSWLNYHEKELRKWKALRDKMI
jgi:hypothetical protein